LFMYLETADLLLYVYAVAILLVDSKIARARIKDFEKITL